MKKAMVILVLALLPGTLFAETVMLLTRVKPDQSKPHVAVEQSIAVEDGVEDQFFSSGHIIFDAGISDQVKAAPNSVNGSDGWAEETAKSGGATFLLIVSLEYAAATRSAILPSAATYRFMDLKTGSTLAEGNVDTKAPESELKTKKPYEIAFALGQKIAKFVMTSWEPTS